MSTEAPIEATAPGKTGIGATPGAASALPVKTSAAETAIVPATRLAILVVVMSVVPFVLIGMRRPATGRS
jgi:hypothetical protein